MRLPEHVSGVDLADLTGYTPRWLAILCEKGVIEKDDEGRYRLREVVPKIVAYVRDTEKQRSGDTSAERLRQTKALEVERRIAREDRTVILLEEAMETIDFLVGRFTEALTTMPAKVTRDVKERNRLEEAIAVQRNELADDLAKAAAALSSGRSPSASAEEDDL